MRAVVYTAIFGDYDQLHQPAPQDEQCDFICFTDRKTSSRVGAWRVIHVKADHQIRPQILARRFKILNHRIFPDGRLAAQYARFSLRRRVDLSIWIDASIRIKSASFVRDMRGKLNDGDWAMFVHPDRDCIYEEARLCVTLVKCRDLPILPQVEAYRSTVPPHSGLYACGVVVRREPSVERLNRVHELWWEENLKWTYRDQLSLPFVLRQIEGCDPVPIREHLRDNTWFEINPHSSAR